MFRMTLSAAGSLLALMPKVSTRTLVTPGERNTGSLGPSMMFLTPSFRSTRRTRTAFCSYHAMLKASGS